MIVFTLLKHGQFIHLVTQPQHELERNIDQNIITIKFLQLLHGVIKRHSLLILLVTMTNENIFQNGVQIIWDF